MSASKRIPISAAKKFAQENGFRQVIIIGLQDNDQHIVTYGTTKEDCRQAGIGGDNLKKIWGWPKATLSKYSNDPANDDA